MLLLSNLFSFFLDYLFLSSILYPFPDPFILLYLEIFTAPTAQILALPCRPRLPLPVVQVVLQPNQGPLQVTQSLQLLRVCCSNACRCCCLPDSCHSSCTSLPPPLRRFLLSVSQDVNFPGSLYFKRPGTPAVHSAPAAAEA